MGKGHLWTPDLWPVLFCKKRRRWNVGLLPDDVPFAPSNMSTRESRENSMCNMSIDFFIVHSLFSTVQSSKYNVGDFNSICDTGHKDGLSQDEWKLLLRPRLTGMACPGHHDWPSLSRALSWRHDAFNIHDHHHDQFQISIVIHALDSDSETSKFFLTL